MQLWGRISLITGLRVRPVRTLYPFHRRFVPGQCHSAAERPRIDFHRITSRFSFPLLSRKYTAFTGKPGMSRSGSAPRGRQQSWSKTHAAHSGRHDPLLLRATEADSRLLSASGIA